MLRLRRPLAPLLIGGTVLTLVLIAVTITLCLSVGQRSLHLAVVAFLTTGGPLISRIFEGRVRRAHLLKGLARDCVEAEDETMIARSVPLLMPLAGGFFAFTVMG